MESSRKQASYTIFYGSLINPKSLLEYEALPRAVLAYGPDGNVLWIEADVERKRLHDVILSKMQDKILSINEIDLKILSNSQFIMPGFIDTHTVSLLALGVVTCRPRLIGFSMHLSSPTWEGLAHILRALSA